jgi:hypothetical protein
MDLLPALVWVLVLLIAAYVALITRSLFKLCKPCRLEELSPEWFEQFSTRSYSPMERLLSREDFTFLSRQPGFDAALYRKLRRDRLRIFRQYLSRMIGDFNRLHLAARLIAAHSPSGDEMARKLLVLRLKFSCSVLLAESRYALCCVGVNTLSASALIAELEELTGYLGNLSHQPV